ncbi:ribosomal protein S19, mitochondrial [Trifolium repens]|nr:ribosomal protein S19, mitochondrial [Trifolium repens]
MSAAFVLGILADSGIWVSSVLLVAACGTVGLVRGSFSVSVRFIGGLSGSMVLCGCVGHEGRRMRPTDFLRVLNKQFLGIASDTANTVAKKLTSSAPVVSRKPAFIDAFLYKMKKNPELLKNKTIWSRRSTILPEFVDSQVKIYNGKTTIRCKITEGKVGHKFDKEHSLFTSEVFNMSIDNKGFIKFDNGYCCIHWVHWLNCSQILSS